MRSLRFQLTIWLVVLLSCVSLAAGMASGYQTYREQAQMLDDQLRQIALSVGETPSAAGEQGRLAAGSNSDDRLVVKILNADGYIIVNSDTTADVPLPTATGFTDHLDGDVTWHIYTLFAGNRVIQVAQDFDIRQEAMWQSVKSVLLPILLVIPLSWLVVGWVVRRLFEPLSELSQQVEQSHAAQPISLADDRLPGEIAPLVRAINGFLARQHELLMFQERFISDAAHQLKTPVTALTLQLQNLRREIEGQPVAVRLESVTAGLARMASLLNQLLNLARAEAGQEKGPEAITELSTVARAVVAELLMLAADREIDLGFSGDAKLYVKGAEVDVAVIINNLIDNALRYTDAGGAVDVDISPSEHGQAVLTIRDNGPGLDTEALARVFDRFYRHAPVDTAGSGLGLAIVQALCQRIGAKIELRNRLDRSGLEAVVTFKAVEGIKTGTDHRPLEVQYEDHFRIL